MRTFSGETLGAIREISREINALGHRQALIQGLPGCLRKVLNYENMIIYYVDPVLEELEPCYSNLSGEQRRFIEEKVLKMTLPGELGDLGPVIDSSPAGSHLYCLYLRHSPEDILVGLFRSNPWSRWEEDALEIVKYQVQAALRVCGLKETQKAQQQQVLRTLSRTIEVRSPYTRGHSERVAQYAVGIGRAQGLPEKEIRTLNRAALLHDIGKVGVPDSTLNKPGKLTPEEYAEIKEHSREGARILEALGIFQEIIPHVLHHHERHDGTGYPYGLEGDAIPVGARIIAVADTLDALTSDRVYRRSLPWRVAVDEIVRNKGSQFEPGIIGSFLEYLEHPELQFLGVGAPVNLPGSGEDRAKKVIPLLCKRCGIALPYPREGQTKCFICGEIFVVEMVTGKWYYR